MKLCRLKLKNLNSFRDPVDIDFEKSPLDNASLVAITGPTGSGKTTLLDAICVALYGKTPRLSGTGSQNPSHLVSHGETEGSSEVHFIANATRYIATWSIKRGSSAKVRLSYAENDKLISDKLSSRGKSLGSSQRTVSEEVESILGLDFDAFRRSVMLAQGEFAAFLKASSEERRTILEATAGVGIYDVLKQALNEKVSEVEAEHQDVLQKIGVIPEVSYEQLAKAERELESLQANAETLGAESQKIQTEETRETERKENYEKLQSSEARQREILAQQPEIDALQVEKESAGRAERLRPEKQAFDNAKSDLAKAEEALNTAATEKTNAEEQVKTAQADLDGKEAVYQTASTEHKQKTDIYRNAKLDVSRAVDQFAEADNRTPELEGLANQIDTLSNRLTDRKVKQTQLQKQIGEAKTFLDKNPLPSDRQHRLTQANVLISQLGLQENQLETTLTIKAQHDKNVVSLKHEIGKLSKTHKERLSEKTDAEATLETATLELNKLLEVGTGGEWNARKRQASKAQPIAEKYEAAENDLADAKDHLHELNKTKTELDTEVDRIEAELICQREVCQHAEGVIQSCEEALKSAMLANPINQFRQHLHAGEPCLVCGATEHPFADVVEPESEELLQNAGNALADAKTGGQAAQDELQTLKTSQIETKRDIRNTIGQINQYTAEITKLRDGKAQHLAQWQEIYSDADVSSEWAAEQIEKADTTIADLGKAEQTHTEASFTYHTATQQLENCENDIKRETKSLNDAEGQLQGVINDIEDLKEDIASTEERFWEFLPEAFHEFIPQKAVNQFGEKIEEVTTCSDELSSGEAELKLLNSKIETDQSNLKGLQENYKELQAEIDDHRSQGKVLLTDVREKTGGLETEDEIDAAIDKLEAELQSKETERDDAQQQLQESRNLLTGKQTAHELCDKRHEECSGNFQTSHGVYFDKLNDAGFDSPEAHDNAFLDDAPLQEITDRIDAYEKEKQELVLEITRLQTRFEEAPFDSEALGRIEAKAKEIGAQLQEAQQEVGAQRNEIETLKDALEKREALGSEMRAAEQELGRWKRLQETIPANALRDFALEIMFKQMGTLANEQLRYLTSERYQLKVEDIGDLTVIDRWNANEERPVETLSGGESFLTSLALALALADLSRGRAQLNSLFLDEGFGTLDNETLDIAIAALEGLRVQGRSIFLISHIQELTRRLPVKINVRKHGSSNSDSSFSSDIDIRG